MSDSNTNFTDQAASLTMEGSPGLQFDELTDSEIRLLRDLTLSQARDVRSQSQSALLLLGRVWWQIEREARRREREVAKLERWYFSR